MSFNFNEYYNQLNEGNVLLAYKGSITSDLINNVLEVIESKLDDMNEIPKIRKKIYNVLVESLQNLFHHVDIVPDELKGEFEEKFAVVVIAKHGEEYKINVGNFITEEKKSFLQDKIEKINSLSQEELKDMYKFILNHQRLSAKGGGGLGFVDIARKTGKKLNYKFTQFNDTYYFYNLEITL